MILCSGARSLVRAFMLAALLAMRSFDVYASTGFDGECTSISLSAATGRLLTTDQNGKLFEGTMLEPLRRTLPTAGNVNRARYVAGDSRILLEYQSGALELVDASSPATAVARLPAFTYVDVKVSRNGRLAVGLLPGSAAVEVLDLSANDLKRVGRYEHPLGAVFTAITIASELPVVAMLDEKHSVHLFDWTQGKRLPTPTNLIDTGLRKLSFVSDDLLWATVDAGLMPIGTAVDLSGRSRTLVGMSMTRNARIIDVAQGQVLLGSDDLGFTDVLRRTVHGTQSSYESQGPVILAPGLHDAVADPARDLAALCGSALEVVSLSTGARLLRARAPDQLRVFVDNVTEGAEMALVRDMEGRGAIWSVPQGRYVSMLPRVQLRVFPAWGAVDGASKSYLSFGQTDVLTVGRPIQAANMSGLPAYAVSAVPVPFNKQRGEAWQNTAVFAPGSGQSAYVVRPEMISTVSWSLIAANEIPTLTEFVSTPSSASHCPAFSGRLVASEKRNILAVVCVDGIAVYDIKTRRRTAFIQMPQWSDVSARLKVWVSSLAFSPDGYRLAFSVRVQRMFLDRIVDMALSADAPTVYVYDLRSATLKPVRTAGQVPVTAIAFSPDAQQVWVGGRWGDVAAYGAEKYEPLWRQRGIIGTVFGITFDARGDAVVWTDAGLIATVRQRDQLASSMWFLSGGRADGNSPQQFTGATSTLQLAAPLPVDFLTNPRQNPTLELTLKVPPAFQEPLQSLLYVDRVAVATGRLMGPAKDGVMHLTFPTQGITQGDLNVGLFAKTGGVSTDLLLGTVTVRSGIAGAGRLIGAFVGIGEYDDPKLEALPFASGDAQALASALEQDGALLRVFPPGQRKTKDEVLRFLKSARDSARPEDTLILFLSGHGQSTPDNRFVLAASDTRLSERNGPRSGMSPDDLLELVAAGRQGDTVLVLDTCASGAFIGALLRHPLLSDGPLSLGSSGRALVNSISVLAAAGPVSVAKEGYAGRGLLTGVILDGLKGPADADRDGTITQRELMDYVDRAMVTVSRKVFATAPQDPVLHYGTTTVDLLRRRAR